ncbi:MAG: radical SAM protein, partial [Abditibacteriota bacterium]|nr:radical SAM protein [Abditibacteriota bacterium]
SLLRGSQNLRIIYLRPEYRPLYEKYLEGRPLCVQNFRTREGVISAGIHKPGYKNELMERLAEKGVGINGKE